MPRRIAIFTGTFNPPGLHHRKIVQRLTAVFDEVRVVPYSRDLDAHGLETIPPVFLAALCDITFGDLPKVTVDLNDLEADLRTLPAGLEEKLTRDGVEIWHVVEAEHLFDETRSSVGGSPQWAWLREAWDTCRFAVITKPGYSSYAGKLPPRHEVIHASVEGTSAEIRYLLLHGEDASRMLLPRAWDYIERYGLYRGTNPSTWSRGTLAGSKGQLCCAPGNQKAQAWAQQLSVITDEADPAFVMVLGGDGTMLRSIRDGWRRRLPFFGVNAGHVGFLLNAADQVLDEVPVGQDVIFRQLPLIYVEVETEDGDLFSTYAFNDAWLERAGSHSAWLKILVNDVPRIEKLVSDGALVCTAAGSTAYARAMGAAPLLADTPAWLLVGSNVMEPANWKSALLSPESTVEITNLDLEERPVVAYVDGVPQGRVRRLCARVSRAGSAELVFLANRDMAEKIANIQFSL